MGREDKGINPMNVLLCITGLNKGGAEKNFTVLCTRTRGQGYSFSPTIVSWIGGYYQTILRSAGLPVFVLIDPVHPITGIKNIIRYVVFLITHRSKFDIVQAFMPHEGLLAILSNIIIRKPIVYCIRNSQIHAEFHKGALKRIIRSIANSLSMRFASVVTCNTPFMKTALGKWEKKDIRIVSNAIEPPEEGKYRDPGVHKAYFNHPDDYYIVSICNMRHPQKDILTLLRVAKELNAFKFILVGDGNGLPSFKSEAQCLGLSNVVFTGAYENIYPFLFYAHQYILLTRYEGFPNTVLEAMISKVPVVMSDIPEIQGILLNEQNCLLVKNGDIGDISGKIIALKENHALRRRIIENGYATAMDGFTVPRFIASNYQLYNYLTGS
jgi:glycosyltransferase involved in cell wall biosynthesis